MSIIQIPCLLSNEPDPYFMTRILEEALKLFMVLFDNGVDLAAMDIAEIYYDKTNFKKAFEWYSNVKEKPHVIDATIRKAEMCESGIGTPIDKQKGFKLRFSLPEMSTYHREYNLCIYYLNGEGVTQDYKQAYKFGQDAYKLGYLPSLVQMSNISFKQKKYLRSVYLRIKFILKGIGEIIRIYVLGKKNKYIYFKDSL